MANEVSMQATLSVNKGTVSITKNSGILLQDAYADLPELSTVVKAVDDSTYQTLTDDAIYNVGIVWIKNLGSRDSTTDYSSPCAIGTYNSSTWVPFGYILPQEVAMFRLHPSSVYRVQSVDGDCKVEIALLEDNRYNEGGTFNPDEDDYTP